MQLLSNFLLYWSDFAKYPQKLIDWRSWIITYLLSVTASLIKTFTADDSTRKGRRWCTPDFHCLQAQRSGPSVVGCSHILLAYLTTAPAVHSSWHFAVGSVCLPILQQCFHTLFGILQGKILHQWKCWLQAISSSWQWRHTACRTFIFLHSFRHAFKYKLVFVLGV